MHRRYKAAVWAALLLFWMAAVVHADGSGVSRLDVVDEGGDVLTTLPIRNDDTWCLLWNHSVAGFTVSDCFVIQNDILLLYSSHQPDFAAGLGYLDGRGKLASDGHGGYLISDINEPVPANALVLRVGSMAVNHRVLYKGKETSLSQMAAGQQITLRLSRN